MLRIELTVNASKKWGKKDGVELPVIEMYSSRSKRIQSGQINMNPSQSKSIQADQNDLK
jgi:hypothetical protein